jgi:hypothetical protein
VQIIFAERQMMSAVRQPQNLWRIAPDPRRRASEWWDWARASHASPTALLPLLVPMPPEEVGVSEADAADIAAWAASLPGWEGSDSGGPPALMIERVAPEAASEANLNV